jgi:hypothetical protein
VLLQLNNILISNPYKPNIQNKNTTTPTTKNEKKWKNKLRKIIDLDHNFVHYLNYDPTIIN